MRKRGTGKKYVKRDSVRRNSGLPRELLYVLTCADFIRPKFLAVAAWLVGAGPMGLNLAELRELTGLGIISCENTLQILEKHGLVNEKDSVLPGESGRWFSVLDNGKSVKNNNKNNKKIIRDVIINPEGIYNTLSCDKVSEQSSDHKTDHKIFNVTNCNKNNNNFAGLTDESEARRNKNLTFEKAPVAKRRRKKLKLKREKNSEENNPRAAFSHDLNNETKCRYSRVGRISYSKNPSENPALNEWRQKSKPNRWNALDWVGYWLNNWLEFYGEEDPNFVDQTLYRTITRSQEKLKGSLDVYWSTGFQIERFRDSNRIFRGNGIELKEFFDWLFTEFLPDNSNWMDTPISTNQIFRITNNFFLDKFKVRKIKPVKKKKAKGKRYHWGYSHE